MTRTCLRSPAGEYRPEVLVLAPEENLQDANLLSLVSQLLEMGIAFELDENWCVPTRPPKELSAYKTCLFPETTKAKYDKDLDAFYRAGGILTFDKYYPTAAQISKSGFTSGTAAYLNVAWGRDLYFYSLASFLLEAGVTLHHLQFRQTLERRPTHELLDECRQQFFARAGNHEGPWRDWGDPAWTMFLSGIAAARVRKDDEWLRAIERCLRAIGAAVDEALGNPLDFQEVPLPGAANNGFETMGHLLMKFGTLTGDRSFIENGIRLATYYAENVFERRNGTLMDRRSYLVYSESLHGVPAMYWLTRHTGQQAYADTATELVKTAIERTQRADGLWHHFQSLKDGSLGACWSRAQLWPVMAMTQALEAIGPQSPAGEFMRRSVRRTFAALERFQDPDWGLWRLVTDEMDSRVESSAAAGLLYCHDRLREMDVLDDRYEAMTNLALTGLKRLYYRGGLAASCRGTACGDVNFYRSRPQGYQLRTHLPAVLAARVTGS